MSLCLLLLPRCLPQLCLQPSLTSCRDRFSLRENFVGYLEFLILFSFTCYSPLEIVLLCPGRSSLSEDVRTGSRFSLCRMHPLQIGEPVHMVQKSGDPQCTSAPCDSPMGSADHVVLLLTPLPSISGQSASDFCHRETEASVERFRPRDGWNWRGGEFVVLTVAPSVRLEWS